MQMSSSDCGFWYRRSSAGASSSQHKKSEEQFVIWKYAPRGVQGEAKSYTKLTSEKKLEFEFKIPSAHEMSLNFRKNFLCSEEKLLCR